MAHPLVDTDRVARALNKSPDALTDLEIEALDDAIAEASAAVRSYLDMDLELNDPAALPTVRSFEYNGSGILDISEAVEVTGLSITAPFERVFPADEWEPRRSIRAPIFDYIAMQPGIGLVNREMGFTRNLDRYEGPLRTEPTLVQVEARWGWPSIPADIQRAVVWTALALRENPLPYISESIEGYSRTIGPVPSLAVPERAQALLQPYTKLTMV